MSLSCLLLAFAVIGPAATMENGLARTPPMGFMTWTRYACTVDCKSYPDSCISEKLIKTTADAMAERGFVKAGYNYLVIDDCWPEKDRDPITQDLVPDKERFPGGMKALGDYLAQKNITLGIYLDFGTKTCQSYPGSMYYMEKDIRALQAWGARYVKMDGCYAQPGTFEDGYEAFSRLLNSSTIPTVFSCSYPAYMSWTEKFDVFSWKRLRQNCNLWRMFDDISVGWASVRSIIKLYKDHGPQIAKFAGPGGWNDPDMIVIGNGGLSPDQERAQMGIWAIIAAPMLLSTDIAKLTESQVALLQNEALLRISQDPLGLQGLMTASEGWISIWTRQLVNDHWAVALLSEQELGPSVFYRKSPRQMGLPGKKNISYKFSDVFTGEVMGFYAYDDPVEIFIPNTGIRMFLCE